MNKHILANRPLVLVADDSRDTADIYAFLLQSTGYRVAVAYDGLTAAALAKTTRPDLVLINFLMPGMTGLEVTKELRAEGFAGRIVITSGTDEFAMLCERAKAAGADACARQPWETSEMLATVKAAVTSTPAR